METRGTPGAPQRQQQQARIEQRGPANYFLGKCVLITGASSGIGRTLAFWYLNNGARVALVGRDINELEAVGRQYPS